jgi:hypothetical protein
MGDLYAFGASELEEFYLFKLKIVIKKSLTEINQ